METNLKAKFHSKYNTVDKNGAGIVMFRYLVSGKADDMAKYKTAQGEYYRENDEKIPMYFTPNYVGDNITLGITAKGKVYTDTASLDKINSLCTRYPGLLGTAIAQLGAQQILGNLVGNATIPSIPNVPAVSDTPEAGDKLDN